MGGDSIRRLLARLLLALALVAGLSGAAHAQRARAGAPVDVCVLRDAAGLSAPVLLRTPDAFDCVTPQLDYGAGDFWVLSQPLSAAAQAGAAVRIGSLWQSRITLHALGASGRIRSVSLDGRGVTRHIQLGAVIEQELPVAAGDRVVRLLWHVEGASNLRGILVDPRIATPAESARDNLVMGAIYAAFAGLSIALLVYNLALWGALRYRFQLVYCAMVSALLLYAFSSSGALAWVLPGIENNDRLRCNYLLLAMSAVTALAFARSFFEHRVFASGLGKAAWALAALLLGSATAFAMLAPWQITALDRLYSLSFLAMLLFVGPLLWQAWRKKSNYLWLFALAWAVPLVVAALRVGNNLHLVGWSFWIDNSTILSMSLEALVSSLGIAYRIRLLSQERDIALRHGVEMRTLADTDPLTGLLNRRAFLREAIARGGTQTLLLADIDHFKHVNDTIGHDGGDEVLRVFARVLRASVREGALIARVGGEEFAILTPADAPVEPDRVLARLRAERMPFDLSVTASIGCCTGSLASEMDWKLLYRGADGALFEAKTDGRDRARTHYAFAA